MEGKKRVGINLWFSVRTKGSIGGKFQPRRQVRSWWEAEKLKLAKSSNKAFALSVESDRDGGRGGLSQEASQLPNGGDQSRGSGVEGQC